MAQEMIDARDDGPSIEDILGPPLPGEAEQVARWEMLRALPLPPPKDRPILFSGPMVRAIAEGHKSQTRRVLRRHPALFDRCSQGNCVGGTFFHRERNRNVIVCDRDGCGFVTPDPAPYAVGDRLWVRETWAVSSIYDGMAPRDINPEGKPNWCGIRYAATDSRCGIVDRPSLFMPRWASRLTLTVTGVKIHRLQAIEAHEAWREGIRASAPEVGLSRRARQKVLAQSYIDGFRKLWDELNAARGYGWAANPWVVALTFDVRRGNIDAMPDEDEA